MELIKILDIFRKWDNVLYWNEWIEVIYSISEFYDDEILSERV